MGGEGQILHLIGVEDEIGYNVWSFFSWPRNSKKKHLREDVGSSAIHKACNHFACNHFHPVPCFEKCGLRGI